MNPFSSGDINSEIFVDTAFSLKDIGQISKPIKTQFGWHILKLISKNPIKPFDEIKSDIEKKVKRDSRSKIIRKKMLTKLKLSYNIFEPVLKDYLKEIVLNEDRFILSNEGLSNDNLFLKIESKSYKVQDFLNFLNSNFKAYKRSKNFDAFINTQYLNFLDQALFDYKENNLANENQEYADVLREYEEGLLLFDIMEEKIWNESKNDSIGLRKHYNLNLENYKSKFNISATIINSPSKKFLQDVVSDLDNGISSDSIIKKFRKKILL